MDAPKRTIRLYDTTDKLLVETAAVSNAKRISMMGAADQRQIDSLYQQHRVATRAEIVYDHAPDHPARFTFAGGRSHFQYD